jgi:outer membrane protein assembly factor BamB
MMTRLLSLATVLLGVFPAVADDWPQWRGPNRNDISNEKGLLKTWPAKGPRLVWSYENAGTGYSGPAIVGNRLYTMGTRDGSECVVAVAADTGKELWCTLFGTIFKDNTAHGNGPRATPTVDGEHVYVIGGQSDLVCLEAASGKKVWSKNLQKDLGGKLMSGWGYCESPLVDGDKVVCTPGGPKGAMIALDKRTAKEIWRTTDLTDACSYSSIIIADVLGVRQYIQNTAKAIVGVAPENGKVLWRHVVPGFATAVIPTPIYHDGYVYASASYKFGCVCAKIERNGGEFKTKEVYTNKVMMNHHGGVVLVEDHLYGYSDSERGWVCQELKSGKLIWKSTNANKLGKGSETFADGHLICYDELNGTVALVQANTTGWKEDGRFSLPKESQVRVPSGRFWTHPVIANGKLYLRDQDLIFCFDVKDQIARAR